VGVNGGQNAEVPFPAIGKPTDEQARRLGYADAEDWYCKSVRASLAGQPSAKADFKALAEVESVKEEEMVDPGIKATILRVGERFAKEWKVSRPYLLLDVEPRMVARAGECFTARERMAARAKAEWKKDTDGPKELQELPPLMDGSNCRFALAVLRWSVLLLRRSLTRSAACLSRSWCSLLMRRATG
jgi:hypothetical protein